MPGRAPAVRRLGYVRCVRGSPWRSSGGVLLLASELGIGSREVVPLLVRAGVRIGEQDAPREFGDDGRAVRARADLLAFRDRIEAGPLAREAVAGVELV